MDDKRFDALAKALGSSGSRRNLLRVAAGAVLGGVLGTRGRPAIAADKVFVCHKGKTQEIAASALPAHLGHGDTEGPCCLQTTVCGPGQSLTVSPTGVCACGCPAGTTDCAGQCRDLATDPANCGACGAACAPANATGACVGGVCVIGACLAGFGDCNGAPGDGCETDLLADPANCGACGTTCSAPVGGWALCEAGGCVSGCDDGFTDCAGVCVDLASDPDHCGNCVNACGAPACSTATCEDGGCVYAPIEGCCDEDADCDDGNPCTVDTCDLETNTCDHAFADEGTECDDDTVCNGRETCDGAGTCRPGEAPDCDDDDPCTVDTCDPVDGCAHEPADDGTACGTDQVCTGGECKCADGFHTCSEDGECVPLDHCCEDDECPGGSQCDEGACVPDLGCPDCGTCEACRATSADSLATCGLPCSDPCAAGTLCLEAEQNADFALLLRYLLDQGYTRGGVPTAAEASEDATTALALITDFVSTSEPGLTASLVYAVTPSGTRIVYALVFQGDDVVSGFAVDGGQITPVPPPLDEAIAASDMRAAKSALPLLAGGLKCDACKLSCKLVTKFGCKVVARYAAPMLGCAELSPAGMAACVWAYRQICKQIVNATPVCDETGVCRQVCIGDPCAAVVCSRCQKCDPENGNCVDDHENKDCCFGPDDCKGCLRCDDDQFCRACESKRCQVCDPVRGVCADDRLNPQCCFALNGCVGCNICDLSNNSCVPNPRESCCESDADCEPCGMCSKADPADTAGTCIRVRHAPDCCLDDGECGSCRECSSGNTCVGADSSESGCCSIELNCDACESCDRGRCVSKSNCCSASIGCGTCEDCVVESTARDGTCVPDPDCCEDPGQPGLRLKSFQGVCCGSAGAACTVAGGCCDGFSCCGEVCIPDDACCSNTDCGGGSCGCFPVPGSTSTTCGNWFNRVCTRNLDCSRFRDAKGNEYVSADVGLHASRGCPTTGGSACVAQCGP